MGTFNAMLDANARFAEDFDKGDAQLPPNMPVAVVTCIDARLHPERFLGSNIGDIHVIRNAGGRATDDARLVGVPDGLLVALPGQVHTRPSSARCT